jgi:tetratricopeptide (TPR) repeat protein
MNNAAPRVVDVETTDTLNELGYALMRRGDYPEATYWLRRAIELDGANLHALNNLATCFKSLGREPEAIALYERLMRDYPDFYPPFNNVAISYLRNMRFAEGWRNYRMRFRTNPARYGACVNPFTNKPMFGQGPPPTLDELRGKRIVLLPEQGLGDELFFLRFVPWLVTALATTDIWFLPTPKLKPMLYDRMPHIVQNETDFKAKDCAAVMLGDLPYILGHTGAWFPAPVTIQKPDSTGSRLMRIRRADSNAVETEYVPVDMSADLIGVTWRAGNIESRHKGGMYKALPPAALGAVLRDVPGTIIVIQRSVAEDELAAFRAALGRDYYVFDGDTLAEDAELREIASLLLALKEYIGVSNTNMHLMAGMGRTARVLMTFPPEWRWTTSKDESPWFPGFRTYREDVEGWDNALAKLRSEFRPS